jgi:hypothetical protein
MLLTVIWYLRPVMSGNRKLGNYKKQNLYKICNKLKKLKIVMLMIINRNNDDGDDDDDNDDRGFFLRTANTLPPITATVAVRGKNKKIIFLPGITSSWASILQEEQANGRGVTS